MLKALGGKATKDECHVAVVGVAGVATSKPPEPTPVPGATQDAGDKKKPVET